MNVTCTRMPATASIAHREWILSDSANHFSLSGSPPRPRGSNLQRSRSQLVQDGTGMPESPAKLPQRQNVSGHLPKVAGEGAIQVCRGLAACKQVSTQHVMEMFTRSG